MVAVWGRDVKGRGAGFAKWGACDLLTRRTRGTSPGAVVERVWEKGKPRGIVLHGVGRTVPVAVCQLPSTLGWISVDRT